MTKIRDFEQLSKTISEYHAAEECLRQFCRERDIIPERAHIQRIETDENGVTVDYEEMWSDGTYNYEDVFIAFIEKKCLNMSVDEYSNFIDERLHQKELEMQREEAEEKT